MPNVRRLQLKMNVIISLAVGIILLGTFFYHTFENMGYLDALYFSIITLTTVGYGDLHPVTAIGKLFTIFYILIGIGILFAFIDTFSENVVERRLRKKENNKK